VVVDGVQVAAVVDHINGGSAGIVAAEHEARAGRIADVKDTDRAVGSINGVQNVQIISDHQGFLRVGQVAAHGAGKDLLGIVIGIGNVGYVQVGRIGNDVGVIAGYGHVGHQ